MITRRGVKRRAALTRSIRTQACDSLSGPYLPAGSCTVAATWRDICSVEYLYMAKQHASYPPAYLTS